MDRFEVIELKGFEEHEAKKEGVWQFEYSNNVTTSVFFPFLPSLDDKDVPPEEPACQADGPDSPVKSKASSEVEHRTGIAALSEQQADNEFILDGFDFSTGVSICQALDLDEDEAGSPTTDKSPLMLSNKEVTDPSALLLKALGVTTSSMEIKAAPPQHKTSTGEAW